MTNLLDNAIRETRAGGTVTTEVGVEADVVVVTIDDECGRLSPEQLRRLSEAAQVGRGAAREGGGLARIHRRTAE